MMVVGVATAAPQSEFDYVSSRTSGNHHLETATLTENTFDGHRAAHRDADVPDNPEPDAEPARALLDTTLKPLEDLRLLFRSNADAVVANRNAGEILIGIDRDLDGTACTESNRSEERRVGKEWKSR